MGRRAGSEDNFHLKCQGVLFKTLNKYPRDIDKIVYITRAVIRVQTTLNVIYYYKTIFIKRIMKIAVYYG